MTVAPQYPTLLWVLEQIRYPIENTLRFCNRSNALQILPVPYRTYPWKSYSTTTWKTKSIAGWSCSVIFSFSSNSLAKATWCTEPSKKFRVRPRYDYEKKRVSRDSKMCCCCCRFCCGPPTTDERIHAPVLHDASQIDHCRYWGRASLPITSMVDVLRSINITTFLVFSG